MSEQLLVEREGGVLRVTLNRPEKLNALTGEMLDAARAAFEGAGNDERTRVVLLSGAGRAFCAGQDLGEKNVVPGSDLGATIERHYAPLVRAIRTLEKPVVARVNGVAAGAGANLAFACDVVVAAASAQFVESFARIGLLPDSGGTWMLPRLIGHARAVGLAMLGTPLGARQAYEWGAIWKLSKTPNSMRSATLSSALSPPVRPRGSVRSSRRWQPPGSTIWTSNSNSSATCSACWAQPRIFVRGSRRSHKNERPRSEESRLEEQALAERCVAAMFEKDRASRAAGMRIEAIAPGYARVSMRLDSEMINGHQTAHGGAIFTLADSAFAFACNSRNVRSVAQHCSITYVTSANEGELLIAEAREVDLTGRFGIYDVMVRAEDGHLVAAFRGHSTAVRGSVVKT